MARGQDGGDSGGSRRPVVLGIMLLTGTRLAGMIARPIGRLYHELVAD